MSAPGPRSNARRQRGAVAIVFGLSIFVLFGFMALVIDLGRTYVVRTELQNAADAAALAGAMELDQTKDGVDRAVSRAIAIARENNFKFSTRVTVADADIFISVGNCPDDDDCMVLASDIDDDLDASDKTFLKVEIRSRDLPTFFAVVPTTAAGSGTPSTSTFGLAVAGRYVTEVMPIGICALDLFKGGTIIHSAGMVELTEYGFRRGVAYNLFALGPLGSPSDPYLLNPVDSPSEVSECGGGGQDPTSTDATAPFICSGTSSVIIGSPSVANPVHVYGNTGLSAMPIQRALNTRFGGALPAQCTAADSDSNIRDYPCTSNECPKNAIPGQPTSDPLAYPNTWMDTTNATTPQDRQTINLTAIVTKEDYGVLWSYTRAARALGSSPDAKVDPNSFFTPNDWPTLYPGLTAQEANPGWLTSASGSPYSWTGTNYDLQKSGGVANRRVLNIAIVKCAEIESAGSCHYRLPVIGVGKFFMQVPANIVGGTRKLEVEFAGLVDPITSSEIKLYR